MRHRRFFFRGTGLRAISIVVLSGVALPTFAQADVVEPPAHELSTIVVTGTAPDDGYTSEVSVGGKEAAKLRAVPQSVSVITKQRIEDQNLSTVADALNQAVGVTVISNDTTQSQYRARGYSLGVVNDGVPAYNSLSGYQQFDLAVYDRVEVLRGPAGLFIGTGDAGGVVNLVRKRAQKNFAASGNASAGSWDHYGLQADVTGPLNANGSLRARAVVATVDRKYFHDRTNTRKLIGYGTLEWDIAPVTTLSLAVTTQDDETHAPYSGLPAWRSGGLLRVSRSTNPYPDWNRYEWNTLNLLGELVHRFDNGWQVTLKLNQRNQDFYFKDGYPNVGVDPDTFTLNYTRRERDYTYRRDGVDLFASGPFRLFDREHRALFGYNYDGLSTSYKGVNAPAVTNVPFGRPDLVPDFDLPYDLGSKTQTWQSGFYGQLRLSIADPFTLIVGARASDYRSRSRATTAPEPWSTSAAKAKGHVTPYASAVFDVNKQFSLYASYSDIFVPQSSPKNGGGVLDPRVGAQYEVGAKAEFFDGRLIASLALFNLRDKNRAFADPDNPGFYLNRGEVESEGWEAEIAGSPAPGWDIQTGYTRLDAQYRKDSNNQGLPFDTWEPKHTFKFWGVRRFERGALSGLSLGLGVNAMSGSKAGNGSSAMRSQSAYAVVDAFLAYRITRSLTLAFNANNLFDRTYYTRLGGTNTYNSYGAPRNFTLTLRTQF